MNIHTMKQWLVGAAIAATTWSGSSTAGAADAAPPTITHAGRLFDANGEPIHELTPMTFTLYDAPVGGRAMWKETVDVDVDDGHYTVRLGEATPLGGTLLDGNTRWLGVSVANREQPTRTAVASASPTPSTSSPASPPTSATQPQRPTGVVLAASFAEAELGPLVPTAEHAFIGATVRLTVEPAQHVHVSASAAFGSTARGGADRLQLSICARQAADTRLTDNHGDRVDDLRVAENSRQTFAVRTRFAALAAGDYEFGLCVRLSDPVVRWNANGAARVAVLITAP